MNRYTTMNIILIPIFFIGVLSGLGAQKYLQLEKKNSLKLIKYSIGDELHYQTKMGKDIWYQGIIKDIDRTQDILYLDQAILKIDQITKIKSFKNRAWSRGLAKSLRIFAISWTGFALADQLFGDTDWKVNGIVAGGSFALSIPIQCLFASKTHALKKNKYRLRLIDLAM